MDEEEKYSALLQELSRIRWFLVIGGVCDAHKFERTYLSNQSDVDYGRRKDAPDQIFTKKMSAADWTCLKCRTVARKAVIEHSTLHERFRIPGTRQLSKEEVPYCPRCEEMRNEDRRITIICRVDE